MRMTERGSFLAEIDWQRVILLTLASFGFVFAVALAVITGWWSFLLPGGLLLVAALVLA